MTSPAEIGAEGVELPVDQQTSNTFGVAQGILLD